MSEWPAVCPRRAASGLACPSKMWLAQDDGCFAQLRTVRKGRKRRVPNQSKPETQRVQVLHVMEGRQREGHDFEYLPFQKRSRAKGCGSG